MAPRALALLAALFVAGTTGQCGVELPGISYDLTPLKAMQDLSISATDSKGNAVEYFMRICNPPDLESGGQSFKQDCPTCKDGSCSAVQRFATSGGTCAAIGKLGTAAWALQDAADPLGGIKVSFSGGDDGRSSVVKYVCDHAMPLCEGIVSQACAALTKAEEAPPLHYTLTVSSRLACAAVAPVPYKLSWGWIFIISFGCRRAPLAARARAPRAAISTAPHRLAPAVRAWRSLLVYLVGGIAYNKRVEDLEVRDATQPPALASHTSRPYHLEPSLLALSPLAPSRPRAHLSRTLALALAAQGLDLIPQWRYWQQLPGLVKDGLLFSKEKAAHFARISRATLQEWRDGRGTREMREHLAPEAPTAEAD